MASEQKLFFMLLCHARVLTQTEDKHNKLLHVDVLITNTSRILYINFLFIEKANQTNKNFNSTNIANQNAAVRGQVLFFNTLGLVETGVLSIYSLEKKTSKFPKKEAKQ